jgi:hypothetical protein
MSDSGPLKKIPRKGVIPLKTLIYYILHRLRVEDEEMDDQNLFEQRRHGRTDKGKLNKILYYLEGHYYKKTERRLFENVIICSV